MIEWLWRLMTLDLRIDAGDYHRASGEVVCSVCGRPFWRHPKYYRDRDFLKEWPWAESALVLICDGTLVHL